MEKELTQEPIDCLRVVLYGPESTGKTTLSQMLAAHFKTEWVPEFSRDYLQEKWDREQKICEIDDILPIAKGQMELENEKAKKAKNVLFCDTNLLETVVYSKAYFKGFCEPSLLKHALKAHYDLYFLMYIDVPWVEDDLRDRPHQRELMFAKFKEPLDDYNKPYHILQGSLEERFATAVKMIEELLKNEKLDFTERDLSHIKEKGITPQKVEQQIANFKRGNVVIKVREAATLKNGILTVSDAEKKRLIHLYQNKKEQLNILKFVPASGAATRMFKAFYNFLDEFNPKEEELEFYLERKNDPKLELFFSRMKELPFYEDGLEILKRKYPDFEALSEAKQQLLFVQVMLQKEGLGLGDYPKGLVPFHKYDGHQASAFEEHLWETAAFGASGDLVRIHFTVAEDHREKFEKEAHRVKPEIEKETGKKFEITYSYQNPKTDTIAVTKENEPFRDENGELFFRPGGHGALIGNLNKEADLVFIKNIDNVVIPKNRAILAEYKEMLAGKLLELREKTFRCLEQLEKELSQNDLEEMIDFLQKDLKTGLSINFEELSTEEKVTILKEKLNRPIRVCGMVRNEGEPGGGPFWVTHRDGQISLQIVESSQIDHENYQQSKIAQEATHFNPVDVVCSFKNYKGAKFDLHEFVDEETSFITGKTKGGKELKALELPGLWNGAMSNWISIFVEVPVETFNPVKTIADLLKPTHLA
jgi:nicotinamide riboside kinase